MQSIHEPPKSALSSLVLFLVDLSEAFSLGNITAQIPQIRNHFFDVVTKTLGRDYRLAGPVGVAAIAEPAIAAYLIGHAQAVAHGAMSLRLVMIANALHECRR